MESRFRREEKWRNKIVERGCKLMVMVGTGQKQVSHEARQWFWSFELRHVYEGHEFGYRDIK
jgi:hypothetical protein